jgi:hypothetical protein
MLVDEGGSYRRWKELMGVVIVVQDDGVNA